MENAKKLKDQLTKESIGLNLFEAHETFNKRSNYGYTYNQFGDVMKALFPDGLDSKQMWDEDNIKRFGNLTMIVHKLMRYCNQWDDKHKDSIHDLGVYAFIQEGIDDSTKD